MTARSQGGAHLVHRVVGRRLGGEGVTAAGAGRRVGNRSELSPVSVLRAHSVTGVFSAALSSTPEIVTDWPLEIS